MAFTTHKNGDDLGMVYGIGFTTLYRIFPLGKWWFYHRNMAIDWMGLDYINPLFVGN